MTNLEIKAKLHRPDKLKKLLSELGAKRIEMLRQVDTYFNVPKGRLKLRDQQAKGAYLIYYQREEKTAQRWSDYHIYDVADAKEFIRVFRRALGIKVVVDKKRILYMYQNARIHVDTVKKLGTFIEIEVVVIKGKTQAQQLMARLLECFKIARADFLKKSYSDLLLNK